MERARVNYWAISIYWLGLSIHWAAFLSIVMQVRVAEMVPEQVRGTYLFILASVGALISTVIELVAGPISDRCTSRWGRRRPFIAVGTLLSLPFILLFMVTQSFWLLVLYFVAIQLFLNWANGPYQAVIPDYVPPHRHGLASAYMGMMTLMGNLVGLALAGLTLGEPPVLLGGYPYATRLLIVGVVLSACLLLTMLWTVLGMREPQWHPASEQDRRVTLRHMFDITLREQPNFRWVVWSRFVFNLGFYTVLFFLEYYLRDTMGLKEQAPLYAFIVMVIATLSGVVGNWIAGVVADRTSKKRVLYYTAGLMAFSTILFILSQNIAWVYFVAVFFGFAWGAFAAVDWALASNLVPIEESGRYMAIWHIAMTVPQVIAPAVGPIADLLNQQYGMGVGWRWIFIVIPVYLAVAMGLLRNVRERVIAPASQD
ncbi:MAG: MFS transporter [Fimbriimonadales bacterium]